MILNSTGSVMLYHYIRVEHLVTMLETHSFSLIRQDLQPDKNDGVLPSGCFENPHIGSLEKSLGANSDFLKSQAQAINCQRSRTYIMCWSMGMSDCRREQYSEGGKRWKLIVPQNKLESIIGYEQKSMGYFPPMPRIIDQLKIEPAQLKEPFYQNNTEAIPVVPSYFATACKHSSFTDEREIRIEAPVSRDNDENTDLPPRIAWTFSSLEGMSIIQGSEGTSEQVKKIQELSGPLGCGFTP